MSALAEHQFELLPSLTAEDGVIFGIGSDVSLNEDGFHPGATEWSNQDSESGANGTTGFGRDKLLGPTWGWDLHVNRQNCVNAVQSLEDFTTAWRALHIRNTPRAVIPLRFRVGKRARRIYGRPRNLSASPDNLILNGFTPVIVDFKCHDGFVYDDELSVVSFVIGSDNSELLGGGIVYPATFPITPIAVTGGTAALAVGGTAPARPVIRIDGPIISPSVSTPEWTLSLPDYEIPDGQYVEIDTRTWANTVLLNGESSIAGKLGRRQNLSAVTLEPGNLDIDFSGSSSTGTATCRVSWANTWNSF